MNKCSAETLRAWIDYEPETGVFVWKESPRANVHAGDVAGCFDDASEASRKAHCIRLGGTLYSATHLAILYVTDKWPVGTVVPKNGNRRDMRFENLQVMSRVAIRLKTAKANCNNKTGALGVSINGGRYIARFRNKHIGQFSSVAEASAAYWRYRQQIGA